MVGVKGGSRACSTCKKRKIKCDLQLPRCGQCTLSRRLCSGPTSAAITIYGSSSVRERLWKYTGEKDNGINHKFVFVTEAHPQRVQNEIDIQSDVGEERAAVYSVGNRLLTQISLDSASLQFFISEFMSNFAPPSTETEGVIFDPWIRDLPMFVSSSSLSLSFASKAVIVGHCNAMRPTPDLEKLSRQLVIHALHHQRQELSQSIRRTAPNATDNIISAGIFLALFEVFYGNNFEAWDKLMKGVLKLFEISGPQAFRSGLPSKLFQSSRLAFVIYSLTKPSKTFLQDPEWMTIPFELSPQKSHQQKLLDIALLIPGLCDHADNQSGMLSDVGKSASAYFGATDILLKLQNWLAEFKQSYSRGANADDSVLYIEDISAKCDCSLEEWKATHMFKPPLVFKSPAVAYLLPTMFATFILAHIIRIKSYAFARQCADNIEPVEEFIKCTTAELYRYCRLICQSVAYFSKNQPTGAAMTIIYPFKHAQAIMGDASEQKWSWESCIMLKNAYGIGISVSPIHVGDGHARTGTGDIPSCPYCDEIVRDSSRGMTLSSSILGLLEDLKANI